MEEMTIVELLEKSKFGVLENFLELNEYKKENKYIPVEAYEGLLETYFDLINCYIESEESSERFKEKIGDILGVKF